MTTAETEARLPALRIGRDGRRHVDYREVLALAGPLFLNSAMQAILSLTDTWFIGHISIAATAAMGATYFLVIAVILLFGGVGLAVQTVAAQAYGGGHDRMAAKAAWTGVWGGLFLLPVFWLVAIGGEHILAPFRLAPDIQPLAVEYWFPRILGAPLAVCLSAITGFFNGIGRSRVTLAIAVVSTLLNAGLNQLFIVHWGLGIAGSAWATTASLLLVNALALAAFLRPSLRARFQPDLSWRLDPGAVGRMFALGVPMGLFAAVDLIGFALFQLMQVKLGPAAGAVTQIVMMLTSTAFYPALGIAIAATTLVGQSIGAGDKDWAIRVGNAAIGLAVAYMGTIGIALGLGGEWLVGRFVDAADPRAAEVLHIGGVLLWIAAGYQVFDALNMGSAFCLRGAGDVRVPTLMLVGLSWLGFVPLAHMLSFKPGEGWVDFLPQFGLGVIGGWVAALVYIACLGVALFLRWRSGAWRRIALRA